MYRVNDCLIKEYSFHIWVVKVLSREDTKGNYRCEMMAFSKRYGYHFIHDFITIDRTTLDGYLFFSLKDFDRIQLLFRKATRTLKKQLSEEPKLPLRRYVRKGYLYIEESNQETAIYYVTGNSRPHGFKATGCLISSSKIDTSCCNVSKMDLQRFQRIDPSIYNKVMKIAELAFLTIEKIFHYYNIHFW